MSTYEKFTKDIGIIGVTSLIVALKSIILIPIIAKTLGASGYGIWTQVIVTLSLIGPVTDLGLGFTLTRFLAGEKEKKQIQEGFFSVLITVAGWSSFIALIFFFSSSFIADTLFRSVSAVAIVKITAIIIPIDALNSTFLNFFRARRKMKIYSFFTIIQNFGEIFVIFYFIFSGLGIFGAVLSILIVRIFLAVIMFCTIISWIGVKFPTFSNLKSYLKFGLPLIPSNFSWWITNSSDRYVIALFLGIAPVGIYSAAYTIGGVVQLFLGPLGFVLPPTLAKLYDENRIAEVKNHLKYSLKYFLMLAIPSVFGISILANPILGIVAGPEFVSSGYLIIPFVAVSFLLFGVYAIVMTVITLVKKTKIIAIVWGIAGLVNLALNIVFVPYIGILGAAISTLIAFAIVTLIVVFVSFRHLTFDIDRMFIVKSVVASLVMSVVILKSNPIGMLDVLFVVGIGAIVYSTVLFLLKGFTKEEFNFFKELFRI